MPEIAHRGPQRRVEPPTRFVYLGPEGTFAEQALDALAGPDDSRTAARSVPEALDAVRAGDADAAVVPLENSIGGAVGVTLDELAAGDPLNIAGEVVLPVEFVLAARAGLPRSEIHTVAAHPQASTQCRGWLGAHLPDASVVDVSPTVPPPPTRPAAGATRPSAPRSGPPGSG